VDKFGGKIVFWGGGVDTQEILPFGTPDQVRRQVAERVKIFSPRSLFAQANSGGFVFSTVHNIQCNTPVENILAMFEALGRNL
jgi:uroporphyrinogen-III decarboxylase